MTRVRGRYLGKVVVAISVATTAVTLLAGCALWCKMRGGSWTRRVPSGDRMCAWPKEPAEDAGEPCSDGRQCDEYCMCSDAVRSMLGEKHAAGELELGEVPEDVVADDEGQCAELSAGDGLACSLVSGRPHLELVEY